MSLPADFEELEARIRALQSRLGSSDESPADLDQVVFLCHQLRNHAQAAIGMEFLRQNPAPASTLRWHAR